MTTMQLSLDDRQVRAALRTIDRAGADVRPVWRQFRQYMIARTNATFQALRHGGSYRGVIWRYFAPQYVRKDGTVVPAWGGVPRAQRGWRKARDPRLGRAGAVSTGERMARITGKVSGRRRPSGRRIKYGDSILQDTGTMRARDCLVLLMDRNELRLGPQGVRYAAYQQQMRPHLFFERDVDAKALAEMLGAYAMGVAAKYGVS